MAAALAISCLSSGRIRVASLSVSAFIPEIVHQNDVQIKVSCQYTENSLKANSLVYVPDGEAKYWIEPKLKLSVSKGLSNTELKKVQNIIEEREDEIGEHWNQHFRS